MNRPGLLAIALWAWSAVASAGDPPGAPPHAAARLARPGDYREWVYLSTGLDMSYSEAAGEAGHSEFDNVFVDPASWAAFKATGHWPAGTRFVLEVRRASSADALLKHGNYQTDEVVDLEMHVRNGAESPGSWGFFSFAGKAEAEQLPPSARCYACHEAHGALDTTFTQFYPTAKAIAKAKGTLRGATREN